MKSKSCSFMSIVLIFSLLLSSCSFNVSRYNLTYYEMPDESDIPGESEEYITASSIKEFYVLSDSISDELMSTLNLASELFCACRFITNEISFNNGKPHGVKKGQIVLVTDKDLGEESYKIQVTSKNICLYYNSDGNCNGVLYGLQKILKLFMNSDGNKLVQCTLTESPDTGERLVMLDCARKYWSVEWIENFIAEMSWMNYNTLELHMTDEQGIRCNIWKNSDGTSVPDCNGNDFSFICGGTIVDWNKNYADDTSVFYSRDDLNEIMKCAEKYHIEVIPSVDFPGHSNNLISRCIEKNQTGSISFMYGGTRYESGFDEVFSAAGSDGSTVQISSAFMRNLTFSIVDAYAEFFKDYGCNKFNICADEVSVSDDSWLEFSKNNGGSTAFDCFTLYINDISALLKDKGYSVRAFNDYILSGNGSVSLDTDIDINFWKGTDKEIESLVSSGRKIINCSDSYCYYVLRQSITGYDARNENCTYWSFNHATAERIYSGCKGCGLKDCIYSAGWNPSVLNNSNQYDPDIRDKVIGAGFLIWGDWALYDSETNIVKRSDGYNLLSRMWSNSAKMWDWNADSDLYYSDFADMVSDYFYSPVASF